MGKPPNLLGAYRQIMTIYCHILADGGVPGELKHLSNPRKRNHRDSVSSGERTRISSNHPDLSGWGCRTDDLNVKGEKIE